MKRLSFIPVLIIFLSLFSTSCKKEKSAEELIIGKWNVQDFTEVIYVGGIKTESYTYYLQPEELQFQFIDDGSGINYKDGDIDFAFEWTIDNDTLTLINGESRIEYSFTVDEGTLILSLSGSGTYDDGTAYTYDVFYTATR